MLSAGSNGLLKLRALAAALSGDLPYLDNASTDHFLRITAVCPLRSE